MRARVAYISSLGTTAILVAAALLMLAVVSAIVAFRGWPGQAAAGGVQTVPLGPADATKRVAVVRRPATPSKGLERKHARASRRSAHRSASAAGLVKSKANKGTVDGLVMEPAASVPMHPGGSGTAQPTSSVPTPAGAPERPVAGQPQSPTGGGITVPLPVPGGQPSSGQVTAVVDTLIEQATPPLPLLNTLGIRR